jgi:hypothetical protein
MGASWFAVTPDEERLHDPCRRMKRRALFAPVFEEECRLPDFCFKLAKAPVEAPNAA